MHVIRARTPAPGESRTIRFEGAAYGAATSFFVVDAEPGQGPGLHVHPYPETWIVRRGTAEFRVAGDRLCASEGDIVVVEAHTPHGFKNVGADRLEIVCIHPSDRIEQTWLEEGDGAPAPAGAYGA